MPNQNSLRLQKTILGSRPLQAAVVAVIVALILARFVAVGWQLMLVNANSAEDDQVAYLQLGLDLREHAVLTDGTRNPLYPALLATFARREWSYFTDAKFLSLAFGLASILAIYYVGYRLFDGPTALLSAFLLGVNMKFALYSTFVLAESLLVLAVLWAWFVMILALRKPGSALVWAAAGGLAGLAYLAKGTGQLVAACFVLAGLLLHGRRLVRNRNFWLFLAAFGIVALPLWLYNWKTFGSPLFNQATLHQMWMDKWEQNFVSEGAMLPTALSYWQKHSWQVAWGREWHGLQDMRFFVAKMLWPTSSSGFDSFLVSGWSRVALTAGAGIFLAARHSVQAFIHRHREAVILTAGQSVLFYVLFAWYMAIVPNPTRFMLPLLPAWLLFVSAGIVGGLRWLLTTPRLPAWIRAVPRLAALAAALWVGHWFVTTGLTNGQALAQNPFTVDAAFNTDSEQPLVWARTGHTSGTVSVLIGPGSTLPTWRHSDSLRFVRLPIDVKSADEFAAFLKAKDIAYIILDVDMAGRRQAIARLLGVRDVSGDRLVFGSVPPNYAFGLAYPAMPCKWCALQPTQGKPPAYAGDFDLGDAIRLTGYDIGADQFAPGGDLIVTLWWQSVQAVATNYTVFTQLLGPDGRLYGQVDRQPVQGQWPTSQWQPGQKFVDKFVLRVDETAPAGTYTVLAGLYDLNTGRRLPAIVGGTRSPDDALALTHLAIK